NKYPQIIEARNTINSATNLLNELSHLLSEYYCNLDMILEYHINDLMDNTTSIYVEGENLLINFGDSSEFLQLESNKVCDHKYSKKGIYRVTIRGKLYKFGNDYLKQQNLRKVINFSQYLRDL